MGVPTLSTVNQIASLIIDEYERYLPSSFDGSLTMLEKVNKIIQKLNEMGLATNTVIENWNAVNEWIVNEGLNEAVTEEVQKKIDDGTFDQLITAIVGDLNLLETTDKSNIVHALNEVNQKVELNKTNIGDVSKLQTTEKNIVGALGELIGDVSTLETSSKNMVGALNELKDTSDIYTWNTISLGEATGYGIISGLEVTEQPVLALAVDISAGIIHMPNGARYSPSKLSLSVQIPDSTNNRKDIIFVSDLGVITYQAGIPNVNPVPPTTPNGSVLLAEISVAVGDTTINNIDITDKRKMASLNELQTNEKTNFVGALNELKNETSLIINELETKVGKGELVIDVTNFGAIGDGVVDDRNAIQSAFDSVSEGDIILIPATSNYYRVVNATGVGATVVEQRANALANGTLTPIKCDKNNITIVVAGRIKATSLLGDLFEFNGNNIKIIGVGDGSVEGMGGADEVGFLETNSQDSTQQWLPSLISINGENSSVERLKIKNPSTVGIMIKNKNGLIRNCVFNGGRVVHGNGTVLFGAYFNLGSDGSKFIENSMVANELNGKLYSMVYNRASYVVIENNHAKDFHEHFVYSYGSNTIISNNTINALNSLAGAIQVFAEFCSIINNRIDNATNGAIAIQRGTGILIQSNIITNASNSVISFRTFYNDDNTYVLEDVNISDNIIDIDLLATNRTSGIDIRTNYNVKNITINNNKIKGANGYVNTYNAGIIVYILTAGYKAEFVYIINNVIENSDGYSIQLYGVNNSFIKDNTIIDGHTSNNGESSGIYLSNVNECVIEGNLIKDTRTTKLMAYGIYEVDSCSKNSVLNNLALGMTNSLTFRLVTTTNFKGNRKKSVSLSGVVTMPNVVSNNFTPTDSAGIEGLLPYAKVKLTPLNNSAGLLQGSSKHVFCSTVSLDILQLQTADSTATGVADAQYYWEAIQ